MTAPTWSNERRKLSALIPWPRNPRKIEGESVRRLQESFEEFGQPEVIAISPSNEVYNGHQRLKSWFAKFGDIEVDVRVSSRPLTEKERERLTVLLHRGAVGEWDFETLANEFEVGELLEWGFTEMELGLDGAAAGNADADAQIDRAAELNEKWQVKPGDLWRVGDHRLICGDCTDASVVRRVMGGEKAQLGVTSPPYGVGKSYETKGIGPWFDTIRPCIKMLAETCQVVVWQLGDLYSTGGQHIEPTLAYSVNMFGECGMRTIWIRIWEKQGMNFGVGPYHLVSNKPVQQYEYVAAFGEDKDGVDVTEFEWIVAFGKHHHKFVRRLSKTDRKAWGYAGVWKINTVPANDDHPAMFPLELPERCIKMHSDAGEIVYEPFSGSGTTLIACERLGRRCRAVEIAPGYVAVALERMATAFPGIVIERVGNDATVAGEK